MVSPQGGDAADHARPAPERDHRQGLPPAHLQHRPHLLVPGGVKDGVGRPLGLSGPHPHQVRVALAGGVKDAFAVVLAQTVLPERGEEPGPGRLR